MFKNHILLLLIGMLCLMLGVVVSSLAQDDACPALVQEALEFTSEVCSATARNQACYGNLQVEAVPQSNVENFEFDSAGDIVDIANIQTLNLSAMVTPDEWGVVLMQVQANLPDTVPGQNVTMLLFGDVTIENQQEQHNPEKDKFQFTTNDTTNIRMGPGLGYSVLRLIPSGSTLLIDGQDETGNWLRVILDAGQTVGWVSIIAVTGENLDLPVVEVSTPITNYYTPMQAFYFQSGIGTAPCKEVPPSGVLIQTPHDSGEIEFLINEVKIRIGSTVFLQSTSDIMTITVLDGQIEFDRESTSYFVPAGMQAIIPLENINSTTINPKISIYSSEFIRPLPIKYLSEAVEIATPPSLFTRGNITLANGKWSGLISVENRFCPNATLQDMVLNITTQEMIEQLRSYQIIGPNTYKVDSINLEPLGENSRLEMRVIRTSVYTVLSPMQISLYVIHTYIYPNGNCVLEWNDVMLSWSPE